MIGAERFPHELDVEAAVVFRSAFDELDQRA
jgi:hypothetical protein